MAPRPFSPRRGNSVAHVESRFLEAPRAQPFQLPRIGEGFAPPSVVYARIRWSFVAAVPSDASEGQLVDSTGLDLSPAALVWIDGYQGLAVAAPQLFGDVYYVVEDTGTTVTRGGTTRELYRVVRVAGIGAGGAKQIFEVAYAGSSYATLYDSSAATITTTIGGSTTANALPFLVPSGFTAAVGHRWDAQLPPIYRAPAGAALTPALVCDMMRTSRRRGGIVTASAGAGANVSLACSIDPGEEVILHFQVQDWYSHSGTGQIGGAAFNVARVAIRTTAAAAVDIKGVVSGLDAENDLRATTILVQGTSYRTVISSTSLSGVICQVILCAGSAGSTSTPPRQSTTLTVTIDGTTGRITDITFSTADSGSTNSSSVGQLEGGRPSWQTSGGL